MDKEMTHTILEANGIKMAKWVIVNGEKMNDFENFAKDAEEKLGYPMFVKPANAGSSVGVGKAHNREELKMCIRDSLYTQKGEDFEGLSSLMDGLLEVDHDGKLMPAIAEEWGTEDELSLIHI